MNKVTALVLGVFLMATGVAFAQQIPPAAETAGKLVEVGNKHCPVSWQGNRCHGPCI